MPPFCEKRHNFTRAYKGVYSLVDYERSSRYMQPKIAQPTIKISVTRLLSLWRHSANYGKRFQTKGREIRFFKVLPIKQYTNQIYLTIFNHWCCTSIINRHINVFSGQVTKGIFHKSKSNLKSVILNFKLIKNLRQRVYAVREICILVIDVAVLDSWHINKSNVCIAFGMELKTLLSPQLLDRYWSQWLKSRQCIFTVV